MDQKSVDGSDESGAEPTEGYGKSTASMFDVLSEPQRRYAIHYLAENHVASLGELAEWIASQDGGNLDDAERIAIALHHGHLPKLADAGLVDYDPDAHLIESQAELTSTAQNLPTSPRR